MIAIKTWNLILSSNFNACGVYMVKWNFYTIAKRCSAINEVPVIIFVQSTVSEALSCEEN